MWHLGTGIVVALAGLGEWLDLMVSAVLSNLSDSFHGSKRSLLIHGCSLLFSDKVG